MLGREEGERQELETVCLGCCCLFFKKWTHNLPSAPALSSEHFWVLPLGSQAGFRERPGAPHSSQPGSQLQGPGHVSHLCCFPFSSFISKPFPRSLNTLTINTAFLPSSLWDMTNIFLGRFSGMVVLRRHKTFHECEASCLSVSLMGVTGVFWGEVVVWVASNPRRQKVVLGIPGIREAAGGIAGLWSGVWCPDKTCTPSLCIPTLYSGSRTIIGQVAFIFIVFPFQMTLLALALGRNQPEKCPFPASLGRRRGWLVTAQKHY